MSAVSFRVLAFLAEFLTEVDHHGSGADGGGHYERGGYEVGLSGKLFGGEAMLVVVFEEVEHVWLHVAEALPASGEV